MARGNDSRKRRTATRAAQRRKVQGVEKAPSLTAAAPGETEVPEVSLSLQEATDSLTAHTRAQVAEAIIAAAGAPEIVETGYELTQGSLAERTYLAAVIAEGFNEERRLSWPYEGDLEDMGVVLHSGDGGGCFRLDDGTLVYASVGGGWFFARLGGTDRAALAGHAETFAAAYPALYHEVPGEDSLTVPITFWTNGRFGPQSRLRRIESATWDDVRGNYSADVAAEIDRLISPEFTPGADGQLLLWRGPPGTGKTWGLRALASAWAPWAEFSYITDPDSFFVTDPSYMIDVLLHESYEALNINGEVETGEKPGDKWRVLILEDTGELLSANAKDSYGQGLSRLLNVVDGMVGQGLRVLALLTTNDELEELHPAAVRPGRCASQITFGPLSGEEATAWLAERTPEGEFIEVQQDGATLAQLYALAGDGAAAFAVDDPTCMTEGCGHMASMHDGGEGACSADGCMCASFTPEEETSEAEDTSENSAIALEATLEAAAALAKSSGQRLTFTLSGFESLTADAQGMPLFTGGARWTANFAPEGKATEDGRIFAPGSITWRELPLSLMGMIETQPGHDGAEVCGRIDNIWRDEEASMIRAAGVFDTGEYGQEIARLVGDDTLRGLSVDIAPIEVEVAKRESVVDENGAWLEEQEVAAEEEGEDDTSLLDILFGEADMLTVVRKGVIGAATVCPFPAFADASIQIENSLVASEQSAMVWTITQQAGFTVVASGEQPDRLFEVSYDAPAALTASAAGIATDAPPTAWFDDPMLEELTPLTITEEGYIYGHAAAWGTCHTGIPGMCTTPPTSDTDYAYFHLKEVICVNGERVSVGTVTMDAGHADLDLGREGAAAHYDNTAVAAADVRVGEDEHGIWFAGAIRPDLDEMSARRLRGAALSGDWRVVRFSDGKQNRELIALLAVNVPGFPIPRPAALVASAAQGFTIVAQVAAGIHAGQAGLTVLEERQREAEALEEEFAEVGRTLSA